MLSVSSHAALLLYDEWSLFLNIFCSICFVLRLVVFALNKKSANSRILPFPLHLLSIFKRDPSSLLNFIEVAMATTAEYKCPPDIDKMFASKSLPSKNYLLEMAGMEQ
jgi:hypothetical protein